MADLFKIAVIPLDIAWADRDENLFSIAKQMGSIDTDTDLVVLPELFSTGFIQGDTLSILAETASGHTIRQISELAKKYNMAFAGSFLFSTGGRFYNRGFFIEPTGEEVYYDKRHLFSLSTENEVYTKGNDMPFVIRYRGWNLSLVICYDLRFPVWCRNKDMRYDIMIVPANWPNSRKYAWDCLLKARAIENQAIYIGADRSGSDDYGNYDSMSIVIDESGHKISYTNEPTGIVYAVANKVKITELRRKFPAGCDADDYVCSTD